MTKILSAVFFVIALTFQGMTQDEDKRAFSVLFYDLAYSPLDNKLGHISEIVKNADPDIAFFAGIKDADSLKKLKSAISGYAHIHFDNQANEDFLLLLSKIQPESVSVVKRQYEIRNDKTGVEETLETKSFTVAKFAIADYKFYTVAAVVKDQTPHPEFNQFDMRRYEIRQLRHLFNEIQKENPEANILLLANLNDTCDMSTVGEIYARRHGNKRKLFDIRPLDMLKTSWTSWNSKSDEYERLCYALSSFHMLPELIREETKILWRDDWLDISIHRPIILKFTAFEMEEFSDEYIRKIYPKSIYSEIAAHFEKDKLIGDKPRRKSPEREKK